MLDGRRVVVILKNRYLFFLKFHSSRFLKAFLQVLKFEYFKDKIRNFISFLEVKSVLLSTKEKFSLVFHITESIYLFFLLPLSFLEASAIHPSGRHNKRTREMKKLRS